MTIVNEEKSGENGNDVYFELETKDGHNNGYVELAVPNEYNDADYVAIDGYQSDQMYLYLADWEELKARIDNFFYRDK